MHMPLSEYSDMLQKVTISECSSLTSSWPMEVVPSDHAHLRKKSPARFQCIEIAWYDCFELGTVDPHSNVESRPRIPVTARLAALQASISVHYVHCMKGSKLHSLCARMPPVATISSKIHHWAGHDHGTVKCQLNKLISKDWTASQTFYAIDLRENQTNKTHSS
jgi:hypothetical protein